MPELPEYFQERYHTLKSSITRRLKEFSEVPESDYFYELCFCICTPQSKAKNAFKVQQKLTELDFWNKPFDPSAILGMPDNYIRFHNQKALKLLNAREIFPKVLSILKSKEPAQQKRLMIKDSVNGFGMKESSHFMRNIGYRNLAILDRHILKHLVNCGVFEELPKVATVKNYLQVEQEFLNFAESVKIPLDELDILFWSHESGEILK